MLFIIKNHYQYASVYIAGDFTLCITKSPTIINNSRLKSTFIYFK